MTTESLLKDVGETYARLFDHRPVITGEINYFLLEFEDRRNDREQNRLQKTLEYSREMSEKLVPPSILMLDRHLPDIVAKLSTATEMCSMILERETDPDRDDWLKSRKVERTEAWSHFMDEMCDRSTAVDKEYDAEVSRLERYYADLEHKIMDTPTSSPRHTSSAGGKSAD